MHSIREFHFERNVYTIKKREQAKMNAESEREKDKLITIVIHWLHAINSFVTKLVSPTKEYIYQSK